MNTKVAGSMGSMGWGVPVRKSRGINGHDSGTDGLEVPIPYIFGPFLRPMFAGISQQNMAKNMVLTYLHLLDPENTIDGMSEPFTRKNGGGPHLPSWLVVWNMFFPYSGNNTPN